MQCTTTYHSIQYSARPFTFVTLTPEVQHMVGYTVDVATTRDWYLLQNRVNLSELLLRERDVAGVDVVDDTGSFA